MPRRRTAKPQPTDYDYFPEFTTGRKTLWPGDEFRVSGIKGKRFVFRNVRVHKESKDLTVVGMPRGQGIERIFEPDRVVPIKRIRRCNGE